MSKSQNPCAAVQVRLSGPLLEQFEDWRRQQAEIPPRSKAARSLIEQALAVSDEVRATQ